MIIGIAGARGSGKSTLAHALCMKYGFEHHSFAEPIRQMLEGMVGFQESARLFGKEKETPQPILLGRSLRYAMQTLGTEWGRNLIHPDIWVHLWTTIVKGYGGKVVADDVRFPNEAARIKELGGKVIGVVGFKTSHDTHASERSILASSLDIIVVNHEGKPELMLKEVEEALGLSALSKKRASPS